MGSVQFKDVALAYILPYGICVDAIAHFAAKVAELYPECKL